MSNNEKFKIDSLTFSILDELNNENVNNLLQAIDNNLKIDKYLIIENLFLFKIKKIERINALNIIDDEISYVLGDLNTVFMTTQQIFEKPRLEPLGYYVYYNLLNSIKNSNNIKRHKIKYGIENILGDINVVCMNNITNLNKKVFFNGYQDYFKKHEPTRDIKKVYSNKIKFDLFYENLLKAYSDYDSVNKKANEFNLIYKTLYLVYHNKNLDKYYREKISNIMNIHKSLFSNPIKQSFGSIISLDNLKSEIINTHKEIGSNKTLTGKL